MLVCTETTDKFQLKTSSTANIDYYVVWADQGQTGGMARAAGTIAAAQTSEFVPSPQANYRRVVQSFVIKNRHASAQNEVTIIFNDGTNSREGRTATLSPGDTFTYDMRTGYTVSQKVAATATSMMPAVNALQFLTLASPVQSNAVANTLTDIPGLGIPVLANGVYRFLFTLDYTANATTTGSRFTLTGPAGIVSYDSEYSLTTTTKTQNPYLTAFDQPAACNASSAATAFNTAYIRGRFRPTANGTLTPRFASEVANLGNITVLSGSMVEWMQSA